MGFFNKIAEGLKKTRDSMMGKVDALLNSFTKIDEEFFEELEENLIMADVGAVTSSHICENLRKKVKEKGLTDASEVKGALKEIISEMLSGDEAVSYTHLDVYKRQDQGLSGKNVQPEVSKTQSPIFF